MKPVSGDKYLLFGGIPYKPGESTEYSEAYRENKHSLDLYLPCTKTTDVSKLIHRVRESIQDGKSAAEQDDQIKERKNSPVVIFVHGGGWKRGDRRNWDHFLYYDINFMAAFLFWFYNFHRNIGEAFAKRGIPCLLASYSLTRMPFPWVLGELAASYLGSVMFTGIISGAVFVAWFLNNTTCRPLFFHMTRDEYLLCFSSALLAFAVLLLITNIAILIFITLKRTKFGLAQSTMMMSWVVIVMSFLLTNGMAGDYRLMVLFAVTFTVPQGLILQHILSYPLLTYQDQARDIAKCVKWAKEFGLSSGLYDQNQTFIMGHSAGGHLVSLLTLQQKFFGEEGLSTSCIKGVISVSGVYDVLNLNWGIWKYVYLYPTFRHEPRLWKEASPLHILKELTNASATPPFLLFSAKLDAHLREESKVFYQALKDAGVSCERYLMEKTNHFSIIYYLERNLGEDRSLMEHCFHFISSHSD